MTLGVVLVAMMLAGCGGEPADETQLGAGAAAAGVQEAPAQSVRACEILDLAAATRVMGPGTAHPGGDTEALSCVYSNPGVATLTLQLGGAELYDAITIMPPHTAVQIGSRGRYNVQDTGAAAVQFVKGSHAVTLSVQPIGRPRTDSLDPLLAAARVAAGNLP